MSRGSCRIDRGESKENETCHCFAIELRSHMTFTKKDKISNELIRGKVNVGEINSKM